MKRIFLIGYMGCGKSTVGKKVAEQSGCTFIDLDGYIEQKYQKTVAEIFAEMGQERFREIERDTLIEVSEFENVIIATGGGAPCFFDNLEIMKKAGTSIYIRMTVDELSERLETSRPGKRPLIAGKTGDELRQFIKDGLAQREQFYLQAEIQLSGSDEDIVNKVCSYL